jgi:mitogen-activated protein kinase kinase kinase
VTKTSADIPLANLYSHANGPTDVSDGTTFVERVLKEDSIQKTFEKGFLTTVHSFIGTARDAQVNLSSLFQEMNLPTFENELVPLISFPTKLAQACLRLRLDYVQKLKDPEVLIIDQVTEDVKISLGLACTLKRQYEAFLAPDLGGNWNLPQCISDDYDSTILEALSIFFRLIHWKLKSGVKGIYFKETDFIESQWATFNDVSMTVTGGPQLVAEQVWSVCTPVAFSSH